MVLPTCVLAAGGLLAARVFAGRVGLVFLVVPPGLITAGLASCAGFLATGALLVACVLAGCVGLALTTNDVVFAFVILQD